MILFAVQNLSHFCLQTLGEFLIYRVTFAYKKTPSYTLLPHKIAVT